MVPLTSSPNSDPNTDLRPYLGEAVSFLTALFQHADHDELVNFRLIRKSAGVVEEFLSTQDLPAAAEWALRRRAAGDVYVGVLPRSQRSGGRDAIRQAGVMWVDCDSPEGVSALDAFPLPPSLTVGSGSGENVHAYWILREPVDLERIERVNKRVGAALGADVRVYDAARVLRVPGTLNHKHEPPTEVRLISSNDGRYTVDELEAVTPDLPTPQGERTTSRAKAAVTETSPTQTVLDRLQGARETGSGWKAHCPAHDDENPSLSICETADGRCLVHCFAGCEAEAIVAAIGLTMADLFPHGDDGGDEGDGDSLSLVEMLIDVAEHAAIELFHDSADNAYARVPVGDHSEVWTMTSRKFKRWLRLELHSQHGRLARADAINEAVELLSARADFEGEEMEVSLRSSWTSSGLIYNLADTDGRVVTVTPDGWTTDVDHEARFLRRASVQGLPTPVPDSSVDLLRPYLNVESDEDFMLIVSWLVMTLRPSGPYPVLVVQGQQGSAKSTLSRVLKALVDPVQAPVRSLPGSLRDLAISAESNWVLVMDNLSTLKDTMSDALCRLATGGGFATRALYTDDEERIFVQSRASILNGIDAIVTRQDLLGRSIVVRLPKISKADRVDEATFWADFERDHPKILGALFDAASVALARWEATEVQGLRMADFARWAAAAAPAFGWSQDALVSAYEENQSGALKASLEGSLLATVITRYVVKGGHEVVEGPPTTVRQSLRAALNEEEIKCGLFPKNAQSMSRALTLLTPALAEVGIDVVTSTHGSGSNKTRWISIRATGDTGTRDARDAEAAPGSASTPSLEAREEGADSGASS